MFPAAAAAGTQSGAQAFLLRAPTLQKMEGWLGSEVIGLGALEPDSLLSGLSVLWGRGGSAFPALSEGRFAGMN